MYEIFENKLFLKETMKKVTSFFPLHTVTFYRQNFEKQKCLELVTSLQKFLFWFYLLNLETVESEEKKTTKD